jgi:hypothetical protein
LPSPRCHARRSDRKPAKSSTRNLLIALGLWAGFALAYRLAEPRDRPVVTSERARQLPSTIPPQPKVDEEERRQRQEHQERLVEIHAQETRDLNAGRRAAHEDQPPGRPPVDSDIVRSRVPLDPGPK